MYKNSSGLRLNEVQEIEKKLISKGGYKVDKVSNLSPKQYKVSSYTGNGTTFEGSTKFNIEWHE